MFELLQRRLPAVIVLVDQLQVPDAKASTVEHLFLRNSPYWTLYAKDANGLVIRYTQIDARRTNLPHHDYVDLTAFNTDGIDVTGRDVHVHDCVIWTQDDCISVKDNSRDMLFERITASGLGLTIGSIGGSTVQNITFRDCYMPNTYKEVRSAIRPYG
eukprot:g2898.t1